MMADCHGSLLRKEEAFGFLIVSHLHEAASPWQLQITVSADHFLSCDWLSFRPSLSQTGNRDWDSVRVCGVPQCCNEYCSGRSSFTLFILELLYVHDLHGNTSMERKSSCWGSHLHHCSYSGCFSVRTEGGALCVSGWGRSSRLQPERSGVKLGGKPTSSSFLRSDLWPAGLHSTDVL